MTCTRDHLAQQSRLVEEHRKGVKQAEKALAISKATLERFRSDVDRMEGPLRVSEESAARAAQDCKVDWQVF